MITLYPSLAQILHDWIYALVTVAESLTRNVVVVFGDCSVANVEFDFGLGLLVVVVVMEETLSM